MHQNHKGPSNFLSFFAICSNCKEWIHWKEDYLKTDLGSQLNVAISHLTFCEGPPSSLSGEIRPQKQKSHNNTSHERSAENLAAWGTQHSSFIQFNI